MNSTWLWLVPLVPLVAAGCVDHPFMCGGGGGQTIDPPEIYVVPSCASYHRGWQWGESTLKGCVGPARLSASGSVDAGTLDVQVVSGGTVLHAARFPQGDHSPPVTDIPHHASYILRFNGTTDFAGHMGFRFSCVGPSTPQETRPPG